MVQLEWLHEQAFKWACENFAEGDSDALDFADWTVGWWTADGEEHATASFPKLYRRWSARVRLHAAQSALLVAQDADAETPAIQAEYIASCEAWSAEFNKI
jgi:hypothetical protein